MRDPIHGHSLFGCLLRWDKVAQQSPAIAEQLLSEMMALWPLANDLAPLQRSASVALVTASYQSFGFAIFGPLGRSLLGHHLESQFGVARHFSGPWLEAMAFSILEDLNVLQVVSGEPDWHAVDQAFAGDLWRRIFCSDGSEVALLGLDCIENVYLGLLRGYAAAAVKEMRADSEPASRPGGHGILPHDLAPALVSAFKLTVTSARNNPLCLLLWRIEGFSRMQETRHELKFLIREEQAMVPELAGALAWLILVLSPLQGTDGGAIFPEGPLDKATLQKLLHTQQSSHLLGFGGIVAPVQNKHRSAQRGTVGWSLDAVIGAAREMGLVFEVKPLPHKPEYGLTAAGLRILSPFLEIIGDWMQQVSGSMESQGNLGIPAQVSPRVPKKMGPKGPNSTLSKQ